MKNIILGKEEATTKRIHFQIITINVNAAFEDQTITCLYEQIDHVGDIIGVTSNQTMIKIHYLELLYADPEVIQVNVITFPFLLFLQIFVE